jgi:thioredoxin 1
MSSIIYADDTNFEKEVIGEGLPVLVDFWAEWCAPCRLISPVIDELAGEYEGKLKVVKLDVDKGPKVSSRYSVTSIPTLIIFKNGTPMEKVIGAVSKNKLKGMIDGAI